MFLFLRWVFEAGARGEYPCLRHDSEGWGDEERRLALANTTFKLCFCLLFVKADWSELAHCFGLAAWGDGIRLCLFCNSFGAEMMPLAGTPPFTLCRGQTTFRQTMTLHARVARST